MPVTRISPATRRRARELRNAMTPPERRLWKQLRQLREFGFHFRRQAPIGRYVADFAELGRRLIIELDGDSHGGTRAAMHDSERDSFLAACGFRIVRISNAEITTNCAGVAEHIIHIVRSHD